MIYKVVFMFHYDESKAKAGLRRIPKCFSKPKLEEMSDGKFAVVAGEYYDYKIASAALHKLYESHLFGGIIEEKN